MEFVIDWVMRNKDWVFSGIGVAILGTIGSYVVRRARQADEPIASSPNRQEVNVFNQFPSTSASNTDVYPQTNRSKDAIKILFVDDDTTFRVVKILRADGWRSTRIVKDITSLDDPDVKETDIFFVDIQGVGLALGFRDEGLGLVRALKERFPQKKVVIYSAESTGDRFHEALRLADDRLAKDADPYEFLRTVEQLSGHQV